jgi:predicted acylesterase/phospholipase RssA
LLKIEALLPFQILTLSGGGYLGLYTAAVLAGLEAQTGRPIIESFDLIAGTSIGGIIALGLAAGKPAANIAAAFEEAGPKIFGTDRPARGAAAAMVNIVTGARSAKYRAGPLRAAVERIVGPTTRMADLLRQTVITAVNLSKGGPKVFKTGHHPSLMLDWRLPAVEVAMATSAAPTYFPVHRINEEIYADGGMFANSPDMIAVHEAERFLGVDRNEISVLSVGTTTTAFAFSDSGDLDLGLIGWMKGQRLTGVMIGSQQAITNDMMRHMFGERYVRIDRGQAPEHQRELALDCASPVATADLKAMAASSIAEATASAPLRAMLAHRAAPATFINASM